MLLSADQRDAAAAATGPRRLLSYCNHSAVEGATPSRGGSPVPVATGDVASHPDQPWATATSAWSRQTFYIEPQRRASAFVSGLDQPPGGPVHESTADKGPMRWVQLRPTNIS
jgi:hypothetical protein